MSVETKSATNANVPAPVDLVTLTIDGVEVSVPKGTLVIRAAEQIGVAIPRFCDHPLLDPVGACRQCMVEIPDAGNGRGFPKPQASCTVEVAPGMKVNTQLSSDKARKAQEGMLEFLLLNHPLDCPICDKGGECPLQNQALADGRSESRFDGLKRTFPKPVSISAQVLLDRERCVLCARCTRFSEQISGDPFIALIERGALQQVGFYEEQPYDSYFSGNVIQICPVGALTSADYRFQSRPFDLVSTDTACEHCASGCALRTDHRHFQVKRRLAGADAAVNEEWNCDKGRFAFRYGRGDDRLTTPLVRRDGVLQPASWAEAIDAAVAGLKAAGTSVGVLAGGRLLQESAYAYAKFARTVLGTNNIDCRARALSTEEEQFLASSVAGRTVADSLTYSQLESASRVLLVSFEPEDESPIVFLRLRKAVRKRKLPVSTLAPLLSTGSQKLLATLVPCAQGDEASALANLDVAALGLDANSVILVGERAATSAGALSAASALAARTGAKLAWIPRRAGEVGAIDAGCLPSVLPGGRPVSEAAARVDASAAWGGVKVPGVPGLDTDAMLQRAKEGSLKALVVAGLQIDDLADLALATAAFESVPFLVSFEARVSGVAGRANVVFPVPLVEEQVGTFVNWEHRPRTVKMVNKANSQPMSEVRILAALSDALGADLGVRTATQARAELSELASWDGPRVSVPTESAGRATSGLRLATWRELIDRAAAIDGAQALADTARTPVAKMSARTAASRQISDAVSVEVNGASVVLPVTIVDSMVDDVVWLPSRPLGVDLTLTAANAGRAEVHMAPATLVPATVGDERGQL